jgi:hypothetical protein
VGVGAGGGANRYGEARITDASFGDVQARARRRRLLMPAAGEATWLRTSDAADPRGAELLDLRRRSRLRFLLYRDQAHRMPRARAAA